MLRLQQNVRVHFLHAISIRDIHSTMLVLYSVANPLLCSVAASN